MTSSLVLSRSTIDFDPPQIEYQPLALTIPSQRVSILAGNGRGKTTLAWALAGVIPAVFWARVALELRLESNNHTSCFPGDPVGVVPQRWEHGNLGFGLADEMAICSAGSNDTWTSLVAETLEIGGLLHCEPNQLSSGEKKRVLIAATLSQRPSFLLTDEWPEHLDSRWVEICDQLLETYVRDTGGFHMELLSHRIDAYVQREYIEYNSVVMDESPRPRLADTIGRHALTAPDATSMDGPAWVKGSFRYSAQRNLSIDLEARGGDLVEILGANGAGKTTFLKSLWKSASTLGRLRERICGKKTTSGQVCFVQADPVFQVVGPTVRDELRGVGMVDLRDDRDSVSVSLNRDVLTLSTGERKLLAIVVAIRGKANILALDEPLAGLDENARELVYQLLMQALTLGKLLIVASQGSVFEEATQQIVLVQP